jgi:hypothetical protein
LTTEKNGVEKGEKKGPPSRYPRGKGKKRRPSQSKSKNVCHPQALKRETISIQISLCSRFLSDVTPSPNHAPPASYLGRSRPQETLELFEVQDLPCKHGRVWER